jgi:hypothetical protein
VLTYRKLNWQVLQKPKMLLDFSKRNPLGRIGDEDTGQQVLALWTDA